MALVLCIFVASLCVLYFQGSRQARLILEDKSREKVTLLQRMFELTGRPLLSLTNDYSLWDDMITFVGAPDTAWGRTNIYVGLGTYQADAAWVFDPSFHLVWDTTLDDHKGITSEPQFLEAISKTIRAHHFNHFFVVGPLGTPDPWPAVLDDDDAINAWIRDRHAGRTPEQLVGDYDASHDRLLAVIDAIPGDRLADPNAIPWIGGPLVDIDFTGHLHDEHVPSGREWLDGSGSHG